MWDVGNLWICKSSLKRIEDDRSIRNNKVVSGGWQYPVCACSSVYWCMCGGLLSWADFGKCLCTLQATVQHCVCVFLACCASVCVPSRQKHDRRERWFSLAVVVSESAREPTGSKWYSLVLNARVGRPALLQPLVSCYIMTWRWRGDDTAPKRGEREREVEEEMQAGWDE